MRFKWVTLINLLETIEKATNIILYVFNSFIYNSGCCNNFEWCNDLFVKKNKLMRIKN